MYISHSSPDIKILKRHLTDFECVTITFCDIHDSRPKTSSRLRITILTRDIVLSLCALIWYGASSIQQPVINNKLAEVVRLARNVAALIIAETMARRDVFSANYGRKGKVLFGRLLLSFTGEFMIYPCVTF